MIDLQPLLRQAVADGSLLADAGQNIAQMLARSASPVIAQSIAELVKAGAWAELNDRFFKTLAFGTGGLRGRTIGKAVTAAERGTLQALDRPQFSCVGTNAMNDFNILTFNSKVFPATSPLVAEVGDLVRIRLGLDRKPSGEPRFLLRSKERDRDAS